MFTARHHAFLQDLRRPLFGYVCAITPDTGRAEDLYQDAVVRAISAPDAPDHPVAFRVWMFRLTRNLWIDRLRADTRHAAVFVDPPHGEDTAPAAPRDSEDLTINRMAVRQAFQRLARHHRDVLALVDIGGFSYDETAALLDTPRGTVMSRVSRARSALERELTAGQVVSLPLRRRRQ